MSNPMPFNATDSSGGAWSSQQADRMTAEWRRLQRSFAYHPHVSITPITGNPPSELQIDFKVTTLVVNEGGELEFAKSASLHAWIPPGFPEEAPLVRPMSGIFHPNVAWEGIYLASAWQPTDTLVALVRRIGDLLAYRLYDPDSVVNAAAMDWLNANTATLPLDRHAQFAPTAGGEPLARIARYGRRTVEEARQSLADFQATLLSPQSPDPAAIQDFSDRWRATLAVLLERDVPGELRAAAQELDETAAQLPLFTSSYAFLRRQRERIEALAGAAASLAGARAPILSELDALGALVDAGSIEDPNLALRMIPALSVLQPFQLRIPKAIYDAERLISGMNAALAELSVETTPADAPADTALGQQIQKDTAAVNAQADSARAGAEAQLAQFEPLLRRAREDSSALDQVVRWREHLDMVAQARALERRVAEWGAEGVQAYHIESPAGSFGPFQFEQAVDVGGQPVAVRSPSRGAVEVLDASKEIVLGQSAAGEITVQIGGAGEQYPVTFKLTDRCDDLLVQFDFLRRNTAKSIEHVDSGAASSSNWCGRLCGVLAHPSSRGGLLRELEKVALRWRYTMVDLAALAPLKARIATYHLLHRAVDRLPGLVQTLNEAKKGMKESDARLGEIMKSSGRDVETNGLIVPPKYARRYEDELKFRRRSAETIAETTRILKALAGRLRERLNEPKLLGRSEIPAWRVLSPLPDALTTLALSDNELGLQIVRLEELLQGPLGGPRPDVPMVEPIAPPPDEASYRANAEDTLEWAATDGNPVLEHASPEQAAVDRAALDPSGLGQAAVDETSETTISESAIHEHIADGDFVVYFDEPEPDERE